MAEQSSFYDGFISYSHAADDLLAPRLQAALQRFAKPWWKRRAVRIFRDESSLSANPHLWSSITEALDTSGWFVLLLSPDAARSEWVNQEIAYWVANRDPNKILPVVTDGSFGWTSGDVTGDAVPQALRGVFSEEPRWADVRWARDEDQLDLQDPRFADAVADIASTIRGIPKDDLASEEVRQHRRTVRTAWAAGVVTAVLAVAAVGFGVQSARNADEAERQAGIASEQANIAEANAEQARSNAASEAEAREEADQAARLARSRELAGAAVNVLETDPELSIRLALLALDNAPSGDVPPLEVVDALWRATQSDRLDMVIPPIDTADVYVNLSVDDSVLFVAAEEGGVRAYSVETMDVLWESKDVSLGTEVRLEVSPDGERVAVGPAVLSEVGEERQVGVVVLGAADGGQLSTISHEECQDLAVAGWAPSGSFLAVTNGELPCSRSDVESTGWLDIYQGDSLDLVGTIPSPWQFGGVVSFDAAGDLYLQTGEGLFIFDGRTLELRDTFPDVRSHGDVSPDGRLLVTFNPGSTAGLSTYSMDDGRLIDFLRPSVFPDYPYGLEFEGIGDVLVLSPEGDETILWDVETGNQVMKLPSGPATSSAMTRDGRRLFTGHRDGSVKVWDLTASIGFESLGDLGGHGHVNGNSFKFGGAFGVAVAIDLAVFDFDSLYFDPGTGELTGDRLDGSQPLPLPDGRVLVIDDDETRVVAEPGTPGTVIDPCDFDAELAMCEVEGRVRGTEFFYGASVDGLEVVLWRPSSDQGGGEGVFLDADLNPTGRADTAGFEEVVAFNSQWIAGLTRDATVVRDRRSGGELAVLPGAEVEDVEVSADGRLMMLKDGGGVALVDTSTWETRRFDLGLGRLRGMAIDAEAGRFFLGDERGLHVGDLDSGLLLQSIPMASVSDILPLGGDRVLVGTNTGVWAAVDLSTERLFERARLGLTSGFEKSECVLYRIDPCPTLEEMRSG